MSTAPMSELAADINTHVRMTKVQRQAFEKKLYWRYGLFAVAVVVFILTIMFLELNAGLNRGIIAILFILLSFGLYGIIGVLNFTRKFDEYYVAGRSVPAFFNGMATGADWMSAASFISMAGSLWLLGYDGLAYIMGWTGGYVLLALFFAPYIRKFGQFTIPDFVAHRFPERGGASRLVAAICGIVTSFTYVTAQVVGVGLIMSRFFGTSYEVGVFLGLAGVVLCSFLGGMKSITWTQVAQYIVLIIAYLIPVSILSARFTGNPFSELHVWPGAPGDHRPGIGAEYPECIRRTVHDGAVERLLADQLCPARPDPARAGGESRLDRDSLGVPGLDLLPDDRNGRATPHPDPLLHGPRSEGGADERGLVALLHLPAVLHGAGLRGLRAMGDAPEPGRSADFVAPGVGEQLGRTRPGDDPRCEQ